MLRYKNKTYTAHRKYTHKFVFPNTYFVRTMQLDWDACEKERKKWLEGLDFEKSMSKDKSSKISFLTRLLGLNPEMNAQHKVIENQLYTQQPYQSYALTFDNVSYALFDLFFVFFCFFCFF